MDSENISLIQLSVEASKDAVQRACHLKVYNKYVCVEI